MASDTLLTPLPLTPEIRSLLLSFLEFWLLLRSLLCGPCPSFGPTLFYSTRHTHPRRVHPLGCLLSLLRTSRSPCSPDISPELQVSISFVSRHLCLSVLKLSLSQSKLIFLNPCPSSPNMSLFFYSLSLSSIILYTESQARNQEVNSKFFAFPPS